ncbi:MAG: Uma2 family endonuclease [Gemmataceae bacterium]
MSTAILEPLLTAADLAALPTSLPSGDVRYELDDGELIVIPPPGDMHGRRQAKIVRYLDSEAEERGLGEVRAEVGIILRRNPDRVVGADAAFILNASLPVRRAKEGYLETIPEIVVEVRSKHDRMNEVRAKKEEYFDAGVKLVWVVDSDDRTVAAHEPGKPVKTFTTADILKTDLLPCFAVPVEKLFAGS